MELSGWQWPVGVVAFVGELALVAGLAVAAYRRSGGGGLGVAVAVVAVIVLITLWSRVMAPRAARRLPRPARALVAALLGALIAAALASTGDAGGWAIGAAGVGVVVAAAQLGLPETAGRLPAQP